MDPRRTYAAWGPEAEQRLVEVLRSQVYVRGPQVAGLEQQMATRLGVTRTLAVGSGTQALSLVLSAWLRDRDATQREVIVPAFTFVATAGAVVEAGGVPVFVDVDPDTFLLDPEAVTRSAGPRTAAVIPVHLFGAPLDPAPLREALTAAGAGDALVLEDAAQAIEATCHGRPVGGLGDAAAFSFYPSKNLAAAGDAGLVATSSGELAERLARLREHGAGAVPYEHVEAGTNARMDEMQAAVLLARLPHLAGWTAARRRVAAGYVQGLQGTSLRPQAVPAGAQSAWHLFVVRCPQRDALRARLTAEGVASGVYYPIPLHQQPCFRHAATPRLPVAEGLAAEVLALPCFPGLTAAEQARVLDVVTRAARLA